MTPFLYQTVTNSFFNTLFHFANECLVENVGQILTKLQLIQAEHMGISFTEHMATGRDYTMGHRLQTQSAKTKERYIFCGL